MSKSGPEKLKMQSPDIALENVEKIAGIFPNVITEIRDENGEVRKGIDFDLLRQELSGDYVEGREERYEFTWVGKKQSIIEGNLPIHKTLRPCLGESKDWEHTKNIYIEGDNLEALKLLQESYLNKIKMIYIDPPYNTGNDFVYNDKFVMDPDDYDAESGAVDDIGNRLIKNSKDQGRFHSDWCSMIFPRLKLAHNLLREDGVIFVSIDDNEVHNLRKMMDEIFGEENHLGTVIWKNVTDNNPTNVATEHEYMHIYSKNRLSIDSVWKSKVSDVKKILIEIGNKLITEYKDSEKLQKAYTNWFGENKLFLWPLDRYKYIDTKGVYTGSQSVHNPGKEGYRYPVIHPITNKPCKEPLLGYRFPPETMKKLIDDNRILFGDDDSKIIELKLYAFEYEERLSSVIELDSRIGAYDLKQIFPETKKVFTNPKPVRLFNYFIPFILKNSKDIALDFFSGSSTTAHAIMKMNAENGTSCRFIVVQLPEACDGNSEAYKAGFKNISEIGKERIRRAGEKIKAEIEEKNQQLTLDGDPKTIPDIGFRVFKIDDTNMKDVYYSAADYSKETIEGLVDNVRPDRTDLDLLYQIIIDWGLPLDLPHVIEEIDGFHIHIVDDNALVACFDASISESVMRKIAAKKPLRAVFRDGSFKSSPEKLNIEGIFKTIAPDTTLRVI